MLPILLPLLIVGAITIILIILVLIRLEPPTESPKNTRERRIESKEEKLRTIGKKEVEHQKSRKNVAKLQRNVPLNVLITLDT